MIRYHITEQVIALLDQVLDTEAWAIIYPTGNTPWSGLLWGWLCWVVIHPRECYQPTYMYSYILSLLRDGIWNLGILSISEEL